MTDSKILPKTFRLNQFLAKNLGVSRRQSDVWITKKEIKVNDQIAVLGQKILGKEKIEVFKSECWQELNNTNLDDITILFYKPICSITTKFDPQKRKTIYDFLPKVYANLKPAGRLDYMSEGLLVLSNNGDLIQELTHPKNLHNKIYLVGLKNSLSKENQEELKKGVNLDGYLLNPMLVELFKKPQNFEQKERLENNHFDDNFEYLNLNKDLFWYKFELTEGRNNQIRKICEIYGQKVLRLIRIKQGDFVLNEKLYKQRILVVRL
jgi:23S rRNA pseudouridine2605 synthase